MGKPSGSFKRVKRLFTAAFNQLKGRMIYANLAQLVVLSHVVLAFWTQVRGRGVALGEPEQRLGMESR